MSTSYLNKLGRPLLLAAIFGAILLIAFVPSPDRSVGALLYELVRRKPDPRPELHSNAPFMVIGHRGAAGYRAENTIASFDYAVNVAGANAVEIDLSMTRDSVVVLWHDWDPDASLTRVRERGGEPEVICKPRFPDDDTPYRRPIFELTLQTFRQHYGYEYKDSNTTVAGSSIPTFEEFMRWTVGVPKLELVLLDIKLPAADSALAPLMVDRIERIVQGRNAGLHRVYLTPHPSIHRALDRLLPDGNVSFDLELPAGVLIDPCKQTSVDTAIASGNRVASVMLPYTSTFAPWTTVRRIIECDLEKRRFYNRSKNEGGIDLVIAGSVNDESKIETLIGLGVDGIITDYPDLVRTIATRMGRLGGATAQLR